MEPAAKRARGSASENISAEDSGVLQPIDLQLRILFADAGCTPSSLEKTLIKDDRVHLQTVDLLNTAEELEASIIIGSAFPEEFLCVLSGT